MYKYLLFGFSFLFLHPAYTQSQKVVQQPDSLLRIADWQREIDSLNAKAKYYRATLNDSALWFAQKALGLSYQRKYAKGIVHAKETQAFLAFQKDELEESKRHAEEFLFYARLMDSSGYISAAENGLANIATRQERYEEALERYLRVLDIEISRKDARRMAISILNVGSVFMFSREYEEARDYYRQGYYLGQKSGDTLTWARASNKLATVLSQEGKLDSALFYANQALALLKDQRSMLKGDFMCGVGEIRMKQGKITEAEYLLVQALKFGSENSISHTKALAYLYLGQLRLKVGQPQAACREGKRALSISQENQIGDTKQRAIHLLVEGFERMGRMDSAYIYLSRDLDYQNRAQGNIKEIKLRRLKLNHEVALKKLQYAEQQVLVEESRATRTRMMVSLIVALGLLVGLMLIGLRLRYIRQELKEVGRQMEAQHQTVVELNLRKDRTFSIIAHDIRTPLNNVMGLIEIILGGHIDPEQGRELGAKIQKQITGAVNIFDNLLKWSSIDRQEGQQVRTRVELHHLIENVVVHYQSLAQEKGIMLTHDLRPQAWVEIESGMIETVIRNLLTNAIKFTESRGRIHVWMEATRGKVSVYVRDTGQGISEEKQKTLFNLKQNQSTRGTKDEKGTGLGLPLAKEFIEQHGGNIAVYSRLGAGSTFSFDLPFAYEL
ncbi:MAG: tetratricopeptide repeat-containing sensor histidine kinase [Bacteroidota bacterium]